MMLFNRDSAQFASQKILFPTSRPDDVSYRLDAQMSKAPAVWTTCHTVRTHIRLKHHPSGRHGFPSRPSSVSRSFELLQLASAWTIQCLTKALQFLSETQIWEDRCNCSDDVDSRPDALIHKASIVIQIQTSGRQLSWSGRSCIKYRNCIHQINRPDDNPPSLDARSLNMEITCSERETVQMTGQRSPDAALKQERFLAKFLEFQSYSCPSRLPMTTVRMAPSVIKPDAHLSCQPINRGP